ncbi:MAG: hypothetical protein GY935_19035, partial [Gammaproteobacteria bacterium]|nr:hypothetical protein [Gammaproteobacteria bacterium]
DDIAFAPHFDGLRRIFPDRLEYPRFVIKQAHTGLPVNTLQKLGFNTEN